MAKGTWQFPSVRGHNVRLDSDLLLGVCAYPMLLHITHYTTIVCIYFLHIPIFISFNVYISNSSCFKLALAGNNVINAQVHKHLPQPSPRDIFTACCDLLKACFIKSLLRRGNKLKSSLHTKNLVHHNFLKLYPSHSSVQSSDCFSELSLAPPISSYTPLSPDAAVPSGVRTTSPGPKLLLQVLSSLSH